jgi:hypothetical protein
MAILPISHLSAEPQEAHENDLKNFAQETF